MRGGLGPSPSTTVNASARRQERDHFEGAGQGYRLGGSDTTDEVENAMLAAAIARSLADTGGQIKQRGKKKKGGVRRT